MAIFGLPHVRTELGPLLIIPSLAQHPVQTNRQSPRHSNLGDLPTSSQHQVKISAAPLWKAPPCALRRLYQQEAQHRASLLGDMSQSAAIAAGVLQRNQTEIAGHLLPAGEA